MGKVKAFSDIEYNEVVCDDEKKSKGKQFLIRYLLVVLVVELTVVLTVSHSNYT